MQKNIETKFYTKEEKLWYSSFYKHFLYEVALEPEAEKNLKEKFK